MLNRAGRSRNRGITKDRFPVWSSRPAAVNGHILLSCHCSVMATSWPPWQWLERWVTGWTRQKSPFSQTSSRGTPITNANRWKNTITGISAERSISDYLKEYCSARSRLLGVVWNVFMVILNITPTTVIFSQDLICGIRTSSSCKTFCLIIKKPSQLSCDLMFYKHKWRKYTIVIVLVKSDIHSKEKKESGHMLIANFWYSI